MTWDHEEWLATAVQHARAKRYDHARDYALRVLREDGCNTKALWIIATVTDSISERRNALKALLRLQPDNFHAREMLNSLEQPKQTTETKSSTTIRSIKPEDKPAPAHKIRNILLYAAVAVAALVIVAAVVLAATTL